MKRIQFRLQTVLWLTLLIALAVGWWTDRRRQARSAADQAERLAQFELELAFWQQQHSVLATVYGNLRMRVDREESQGREQSTQQTLMSQQALSEAREKIARLEAKIEALRSGGSPSEPAALP